jgi:predicted lipoprotein with Yx(FWY)xxD motif
MSFPKRILAAALTSGAVALIVTGCGGAGGSSSSPTPASTNPPAHTTTVSTTKKPDLGRILVNSEGFTVYTFSKDRRTNIPCLDTCPERSACYEACEEAWPPVPVSGTPEATGGVDPYEIGATRRNNGTLQMTYAGQPLYTYSGDHRPGETTGNGAEGFEGEWTAISRSGVPISVAPGGVGQ